MTRGARSILGVVGALCLVAGLWPWVWVRSHPPDGKRSGWNLGLPCSPILRTYRQTIESPRSTTIDVDGRRIEASSFSSTVRGWQIYVFSWSAALVAVGAILLGAALRSRARPGDPASPAAASGEARAVP